MLIAACRAVLGRARDTDPLRVLPGPDGEPVKLDATLAQYLGFPEARARGLVRAVFGGANSPDLAVAQTAGEYWEWATSVNEEVDEELVGESPAALR